MRGIAFTIVSENTPILPKDDFAIWEYILMGLPPAIAITNAPINNAITTEKIESKIENHQNYEYHNRQFLVGQNPKLYFLNLQFNFLFHILSFSASSLLEAFQ